MNDPERIRLEKFLDAYYLAQLESRRRSEDFYTAVEGTNYDTRERKGD